MIAVNPCHDNSPAGYHAAALVRPLAERVRHYLCRHPEITREEFLLEAVRREIRFCEQRETMSRVANMRAVDEETRHPPGPQRPLSAEDMRVRASLAQRVASLHYQRYGLWPRVRRFLVGLRFTTERPMRNSEEG